ncbi:MAG TPA: DUF5606 domain-containing protein [Cyclobacteriaceae bacterium]|nr:DUF5606 domain-containing protein [Cyclobacteriaceae bacterium]
MKLSEIASVSGKGGLYKVLAPAKTSLVLESLDASHTKMVATTHHRVSVLSEISIYTTSKEGTVPLEDVLKKIHTEYGNDPGIDGNADPGELKSFLKSVLPDYDEDRVYVSDIKKLVKWYSIILEFAPSILVSEKPGEEKKEA